uniref:GM01501p n=1 Tax=Drosophila melanogaster TaxID=7227 RepID=Q6NP62_DROME|nr:GM01501p [Drosophila melanogaster]
MRYTTGRETQLSEGKVLLSRTFVAIKISVETLLSKIA